MTRFQGVDWNGTSKRGIGMVYKRTTGDREPYCRMEVDRRRGTGLHSVFRRSFPTRPERWIRLLRLREEIRRLDTFLLP